MNMSLSGGSRSVPAALPCFSVLIARSVSSFVKSGISLSDVVGIVGLACWLCLQSFLALDQSDGGRACF